MRPLIIALIAIPLGACDLFRASAPEPVIVVKDAELKVPPECLSEVPQWKIPPKGFEPIESIARRERTNKENFDVRLRSEHEACRAGLKASDKPQAEFRG